MIWTLVVVGFISIFSEKIHTDAYFNGIKKNVAEVILDSKKRREATSLVKTIKKTLAGTIKIHNKSYAQYLSVLRFDENLTEERKKSLLNNERLELKWMQFSQSRVMLAELLDKEEWDQIFDQEFSGQ